jgi:HPt (histidine-containing phosphotransfer) domain-containing protein
MSYSKDPAGLTTNNVLDVEVFQELHESLSQPEAVAAIYRKFIENAAVFIGELRDRDSSERIETLHTLKGSAAMMGASRMAELTASLQSQGLSVQVEAAIEQLAGELETFRAAVSSKLIEVGASLDTPR